MTVRVIAHFLDDNSADPRNAADVGNTFVYEIVVQMIRWIDTSDQAARLVVHNIASELGGLDSLRYVRAVTRIYPTLQNVPRDRAINRARVHVNEPEPPRKLSRNTAFPRGSRPINCNDAMRTFAHAQIIAFELT